jgi:UNC-50 family
MYTDLCGCVYMSKKKIDGLQFFALPVALGEGFVSLFIANTMYVVACSWYWYITHLGYRALPFLNNTEIFFIGPIMVLLTVYVVQLLSYIIFGYGYNMSRIMARYYFP